MYLPNKLFEYTMAGLPILSSQVDAVAEIVSNYDIGRILPSCEPADIGRAINEMLADRATLDRMHHNALDASQQSLNWAKESKQLIQLYHKVLRLH
jgi:glycosyltransferase involved in cell wall biosynthesis